MIRFENGYEEERWSDIDSPRARQPLEIRGPGIGEVKPHNQRGMREGKAQLCRKAGPRDEMWLVTYVALDAAHRPITSGRATFLRVAAQRVRCTQKLDPKTGKRIKVGAGDGVIHVLGDARLEPKIDHPPVEHAGYFGHAAEITARKVFARALPGNRTLRKRTGGQLAGPDIMWYELAALYSELAQLVPDPLISEIAEELQKSTNWSPSYDRAHAAAG